MFFQLPIINTYLKNGVNFLAAKNVAITCNPKDPNGICKAINKLIEDEVLYKKMSKESKKNLERFNHSNMIKSYKKLFNNL